MDPKHLGDIFPKEIVMGSFGRFCWLAIQNTFGRMLDSGLKKAHEIDSERRKVTNVSFTLW